MRRILLTILVLFTLTAGIHAQNKKDVLVTIENMAVTIDEFNRIYERNNSNIQELENRKTASEYLELFINFKLKVLEAMKLGMDTIGEFKTELNGYRNELSTPYMTNVTYNDELVKETYQRMLKEVNASHIMIELPENAPGSDTLAVLNQILKIREEILAGLPFNEAAVRYSQDPTAQTNKGELGWFSVFQMVYPFEQAAYSTPVGEISKPVRSRFGYHLLKVNDIRDAEGELKVSHIMKSYPQNNDFVAREKARAAADSLYNLIQKGANFERLVHENSDDARSAAQKGEMPWFSRNQMIPAFADPAFALQKDGEISRPVDSGFGFHIIKRLEYRPLPTFDQVKRELEERIKKDGERSEYSREAFVIDLKKEYNFTRNQSAIDEILAGSVEWSDDQTPQLTQKAEKDETLFSFATKKVTSQEWLDHLQTIPQQQLQNDPFVMGKLYHAWENQKLLDYEDSRLEEKYPEFRSLLQEYHDGILLFNISESKIWQKAAADSAGLAAFYAGNKEKYLWPERYKGSILRCPTPEVKEKAEEYLDSGVPPSELNDLLHLPDGILTISEGAWQKGENPVIDYFIWSGPKPASWDDQTGFITGKLVPPEPKELNEARGYHISDYQQFLEEEWIKELRAKTRIKINKKLLKQLADD